MRSRLVVALLLSASAMAAPNTRFTGTWTGKTKIPSVLLILVEHGNGLSGSITLCAPSSTGRKQESPISDATVKGNMVKFTSQEMNFSFTMNGKDRAVLQGYGRELEVDFQMIREHYTAPK